MKKNICFCYLKKNFNYISDNVPFDGLDAEGGVGVDALAVLGPHGALFGRALHAGRRLLVPQRTDDRRVQSDLGTNCVKHTRPEHCEVMNSFCNNSW